MTKQQILAYHTNHLRLRCVLMSCHLEITLMNQGASIIKSLKAYGNTTEKMKSMFLNLRVLKINR